MECTSTKLAPEQPEAQHMEWFFLVVPTGDSQRDRAKNYGGSIWRDGVCRVYIHAIGTQMHEKSDQGPPRTIVYLFHLLSCFASFWVLRALFISTRGPRGASQKRRKDPDKCLLHGPRTTDIIPPWSLGCPTFLGYRHCERVCCCIYHD